MEINETSNGLKTIHYLLTDWSSGLLQRIKSKERHSVLFFFGWYLSVNLNHFSYLTNYFKRKSNKLYQETKATNSKPSVMREWLFQVIVMLCAFLVLIVERIETIIICFLIYTLLWHTFIQKKTNVECVLKCIYCYIRKIHINLESSAGLVFLFSDCSSWIGRIFFWLKNQENIEKKSRNNSKEKLKESREKSGEKNN